MSDDTDAETEQKLEQLQEQTQRGTRLQEGETFVDRVESALEDVEEGERSKSISLYDPKLAALVYALEEDGGEFQEVVANLQRHLGRDVDVDDVDRSELLRLAIRVGLQEAAPGVLEDAKEGYQRHVGDEF